MLALKFGIRYSWCAHLTVSRVRKKLSYGVQISSLQSRVTSNPRTCYDVIWPCQSTRWTKTREHGPEVLKNQAFTICTAQTHEDTQKQETDGGPCACWGRCDQWHSTKPHDRTCKSLKSKVKDLIAVTDHCRGNDESHHIYGHCSAFFVFTCDTWFHLAECLALFVTFAQFYMTKIQGNQLDIYVWLNVYI